MITPIYNNPPALQALGIELRPLFTGQTPLPPGVNGSYQPGSAARPIVGTAALHQFKKDAATLLSQGYHDWPLINAIHEAKRKHRHVPLHVHLDAYFPTMWKRDLDGVFKAAIDAAFAHIGANDNQMLKFTSDKWVDPSDPRVEIEIRILVR